MALAPDLQSPESYVISLPPSSAVSPATFEDSLYTNYDASFFIPSVLVARSGFDLATVAIITSLLLLSVLSFLFIFHLRIKSRRMKHLQDFNSLWTVRLLLVTFAFLWAVNETIRLPNVRRKYLDPFLTFNQQTNLCKFHVVLSLGFYEPGFLITLLFLVNVSIKKKNPCRMWALLCVSMVCFPMTLIQTILVYFAPLETELPKFVHGSSILTIDFQGNKTVLCTYPFFSCVVFWVFAIVYALAFLFSCWRVLDFVINKSIRVRINLLSAAVMVALPIQILCLGLSWLWLPEEDGYGWVVLVMFFSITTCMAVGEVILTIKPITDALVAGAECRRRFPGGFRLRRQVVQRERVNHQETGL
ncbi:uncharacterized protein LOC111366851 [Olea europaea var. sylvestris]|uniref:uncharacterized protein LOC111366851 n=1 Tax=Olea europaea var. sylvestris TaxID=158386 RepID=UPI000C1D3AD0|nr:uncharacterized protein LOC111366851 [Olea europaea var. sylvestris]